MKESSGQKGNLGGRNPSTRQKVLVVAAHPDDEILGCGGTMARHALQEGDEVHVVFMTDGVTSRGNSGEFEALINDRNSSAIRACKIVGAQPPRTLGFPDNRMDSVPLLDITKALEEVVEELQPQIIYTHYAHDLNIDHQLTHRAVMTACRPQPGTSVSEIYSFEILSSTGWGSPIAERSFAPNYFIDISAMWEKKLAALNCYEDEVRIYPHARSINSVYALASLRGAMSGINKAESFQMERCIK